MRLLDPRLLLTAVLLVLTAMPAGASTEPTPSPSPSPSPSAAEQTAARETTSPEPSPSPSPSPSPEPSPSPSPEPAPPEQSPSPEPAPSPEPSPSPSPAADPGPTREPLETRTFDAESGGDSGPVIERDAPDEALPGQGDVPGDGELQPRRNDTIRPGVLRDDGVSFDGSGEVGAAGEDAVADRAARKRLPTGALAGLLGLVVLAAVGVGLWVLRRRQDGPEPQT